MLCGVIITIVLMPLPNTLAHRQTRKRNVDGRDHAAAFSASAGGEAIAQTAF